MDAAQSDALLRRQGHAHAGSTLLHAGSGPLRAGSGLPLLACLAVAACSPGGPSLDDPGPVAEHWDMIDAYCVDCHNALEQTGGLVLEDVSPEDVGTQAATWEKALRKLRGGLMPPPGGPRPSPERQALFVAALEKRLAEEADAAGPRPGYVGLHRLNRTEYQNAVRDLLGVEIDATALLPRDNSKDGYDNIASVLTVSPTFMEQYVSAARAVAMQAIGDADAAPGSATYVNENGAAYQRHVEGLPLGTRGGLAVVHHFPADGEYMINVADMAQALWVYNMEFENTLIVTVDGREVYRTAVGGDEDQKAIDQSGVSAVDRINKRLKDIRFDATAGPHEVAVAFLARSYAESDDRLMLTAPGGGQNRLLRVGSFEIQGPFDPTGVSETPSRRQIFTCHPGADAPAETAESCARSIIASLARRAYRRPVGHGDVEPLLAFYRNGTAGDGSAAGGFEAGVRKALTAILASPEFLYRYATPDEDLPAGADYVLSDVELASRLSFFLWSSIPDDELLDIAEAGRLSEPDVLDAQVRRMLADSRARVLVNDFAFQWLDIDRLDDVVPDRQIYPHIASADPREDYKRELELFLSSILLEDESVLELLTAGHTFVNERVAALYGIDDVRGDQFRRIELEDSVRFGLLGKGALLMASSYPNRTAPVLRGKFILENLMGSPPAPPPAGVDTDLTEDTGDMPRTVRERMAEHRSNPSCNSCHAVMDPLGLTLENFDASGEWRERDKFAGVAIDASGELAGGKALNGPDELREALAAEPVRFVRTLTEELMTYALGRSLEPYDMPVVRRIVDGAAGDDYRFSSLVAGVVASDAFRMLELPGAGAADAVMTQAAAAPHEVATEAAVTEAAVAPEQEVSSD